jgi:hypothetical protein
MKDNREAEEASMEESGKDACAWDWSSWLLVVLCSVIIFATIPVARSFQKLVYTTIGREFFTYFVGVTIISGSVILLYFLIFRLKVRRISQYIWILICAGLYLFNTVQLDKHPEEAIHFLEYGILSYFIFRALGRSVRDTTVYISAFFFVSFIGTMDEFLQWMMPQRFWDFNDIGLNVFAGGVCLLGIWKGINPEIINKPVSKFSLKLLAGIITANLLFIGLCLSNTPDIVTRYTAGADSLSWLRDEESMTEFGFIHTDVDIGILYSRFMIEELKDADINKGGYYGEILKSDIERSMDHDDLITLHPLYKDKFLYEFLIHFARRENNQLKTIENYNTDKSRSAFIALKENLILERYFGNTLDHSGLQIPDDIYHELTGLSSFWREDYSSNAGAQLITSFGLQTVWIVITFSLGLVWVIYGVWIRRIELIR